MTRERRYNLTRQLRLLLLLLTTVVAQGAWAADDTFTVTAETSTTLGATIYTGTYTSLTLGVSPDALSNTFSVSAEDDAYQIAGTQDPKKDGSNVGTGEVPNQGAFFKLTVLKPGQFVFRIKINKDKRVHFRKSDGTEISTKENNEANAYVSWAVNIDETGTYYLYGDGTKLPLFNYTFTRKVPTGITSLPYHAYFGSDIEPFDDGNNATVASTNSVFTLNSVSPNSGTAIARFNGVHTLAGTELVTLSFTAFHGYYSKGESKVTLYNSDDRPLVSYTYGKTSGKVTNVSFNEVLADGFTEFDARSRGSSDIANGFGGNGRPYVTTAANNPVVTMTVSGSGLVTFNLTRGYGSVNQSFNELLDGVKMNLAYIKIEDNSDNADRGLGIDDLSITSQIASLDYETGVVDWTTSVSGRYDPVILTESTNHYLSVNQDKRNDGSGGATLTSNSLNGKVAAGQDFTISFDMKVGNNNRSGSSGPPAFTIFAANNSDYIFKMTSSNTTTDWQINETESVTLDGTGVTNGTNITNLTWYHYKISKTDGYTYVTITSADGSTTYLRKGFSNSSAGGLGNLKYVTGKDYANFAIDNIEVVPYASTSFTLNGKVETYAVMGEGDLPQKEVGSTITLEYGAANEPQLVKRSGSDFGAYSIYKGNSDTNTYSTAWTTGNATNVAPGGGTFYKFTPKFNGKLSVLGGEEDAAGDALNNIVLRKADGSVSESKTGSAGGSFAFSTELQAGVDYYLYAATPETGDYDSEKGSKATFFLAGFTFTQSAMNREVTVGDLFFAGSKTGTNLARTIPGMTLSFNDNVASSADRQSLSFSSGGTMTIALRQNGYSAEITNVTLLVSAASSATVNGQSVTSAGNHAFTISPAATSATISCTAGEMTITGFIVSYDASDAASYKLWLNEDKTDVGTFAFTNSHIMRVPGDGVAFTNSITFSGDGANKWWVENTDYLHTSSNTSVATINTNGTNGQLLLAGSATITATFMTTEYFNQKTATYTVSNVLMPNETYDVSMTSGQVIRIGASAAAENTDLNLNGGYTSATTLTYGTTEEKLYTKATSDGTVTVKNETGTNITINTLQVFTSRPVAWLYYEGQENNYSMQVQFQNFASGDIKGFRVYDIGDPIDPIDLTDAYEWKAETNFVWTNGSPAWTLSGDFNAAKGSFTATGRVSGTITTLPTITHLLSRKTDMATNYPDEMTATANIYIAEPSDEDGDGDDDTYKIWDFTAGVTGSGQMDSRWSWNSHGYYQTWVPEYLPILNNTGKTLSGNEGIMVKGDLRYHTGTTGLRMNLTHVNTSLSFPVKAGMEIKVEMASASADVDHLISNVTDLAGNATNSLYVEYASVDLPVTVYYLAKADGAVEIHSMDRTGGYLKRITLEVPRIHFDEEIVTVAKADEEYDITNLPYNTGDATLTYTIATGTCKDINDVAKADDYLATIPNANLGKVTVKEDVEGYVTVNVVNASATGVQPKKGSYKLYVLDFKFDPAEFTKTTDVDGVSGADYPALDLSNASNGEVVFDKRPYRYDKVVQLVNYSMSFISGSPRGWLTQNTMSNPRETTYQLVAYSPGTIRVTAKTGRITTYCDVLVEGGNLFAEVAPARSLEELPTEGSPATRYFLNELPEGFNITNTTFTIDKVGTVNCGTVTSETIEIESTDHYYAKIPNITGYGALRVTAIDNNGTGGDTSDDKEAQFVLTVAYPASGGGHKWDFYRQKNYDSGSKYGLKVGQIAEYNGDATQTEYPVTITGTKGWTTLNTGWDKVYRKGNEQPRWAYTHSMKGYNAFIIEETAGLIIESGLKGFYIDNPHQPTEFAYNLIGLHNHAIVTIPCLKKGDFIALNLSRTLPNSGAILSATNATDLAGNVVDHSFTITRSQTDYRDGSGNPAVDEDGARVIPGYYTFQATEDGNVSFTLEDEGYLDILSIEIYDGSYQTTMTDIKADGTLADLPVYYLKEDNDYRNQDYPICNLLNSTSVGPADYVLMDKIGNLDATLENELWYSSEGAAYNKGHLSVKEGYGKVMVRMNNYTVDKRYLIGYTPTYSLTVGHPPHQDYPFTWNFENISGGAVKGRSNNAYNSIRNDYQTWTSLGYETYILDTETANGSLYVPGATLVTSARDLGARGTFSALNSAGKGCDEFNGLGFNGKIAFKLAQQGETANDAPSSLSGSSSGSLLAYTMNTNPEAYAAQQVETTWTPALLDAGDGKVKFGSPGKREASTHATCGYVYKMDGGNTKNVLLVPERPFQIGDVIHLKGYASSTVQKSGFSFYAAATDAGSQALVTINWSRSHTADTEGTLDYTVKRGDGIAGRSEVYLFRAGKTYTTYLSEVSITGTDNVAPTAYSYRTRALNCTEATTITIPDLTTDQYVYIKSDVAPSSVSNLTAAIASDGLDATTNVRKYTVAADGNATVSFAANAKVYAIGVTNILKPLTRVGTGDAWATESRNHAIDYTQTGNFTVNDISANTVSATSYSLKKVTVRLDKQNEAMPENTGMVLKLKLKYNEGDDKDGGGTMTAEEASTATTNAVADFAKAKSSNQVPLFYPPYSTPIQSSAVVGFNGTSGNLMKENVTEKTFTSETETIGGVDYTPFIFASRYMTWKKENETLSHDDDFTNGTVPVFYRLHVYDSSEASALSSTEAVLNTLGANKAYMLLRSSNVPEALWDSPAPSRPYIAIEGVSDIEEFTDHTGYAERTSTQTYNLKGQAVDQDRPLPPGIYIRNGKKYIVK